MLERLDKCRSVGLDGISLRVLKLCICCCIFLTNKSKFTEDIAEWSFAGGLEVCQVTHIYKKGPTKLPSSYRPIAVLQTLSPTFEIVIPQLRKRLLQYSCDEQFGFEPTGTYF